MEEVFKRLESVDVQQSSRAISRLQKRLSSTRDPQLLGELIEHYLTTGSKQTLNVLLGLKDVQSQDFFTKLNECIQWRATPVLRLLAYCLNKQTSWLYKIVHHPLFTSILHHMKASGDVVVLTSSVLVVTAILPLVPSYLARHLPDLFEIFADLATARTTNRLKFTPKELYLHLDVATYYFFLQLYAMFPCNLFTYLRGRYGPTGERRDFQEHIAPLFNLVQFHPGLVMDSTATETHGNKWRSMEPDEIATLSLSMCLDPAISLPERQGGSSHPIPSHLQDKWESSAPDSLSQPYCDEFPTTLQPGSAAHSEQSSCYTSDGVPSPQKGPSPRHTQKTRKRLKKNSSHSSGNSSSGDIGQVVPPVNNASLAGYKTTEELSEMYSPFAMFDSVTPRDVSRQPSRMSFTSQTHTVHSTISSPSPETSATPSIPSSTQHTPHPMTTPTFTYKNYSPTASVDNESLPRPPPAAAAMTQSAVHHSSLSVQLDEAPFGGASLMTQSLKVSPVSSKSSSSATGPQPINTVHKSGSQSSLSQPPFSLKTRFERFIGMFSKRRSGISESVENEEFSEITTLDVIQASWSPGMLVEAESAGRGRASGVPPRREVRRSVCEEGGGEEGEVGVEEVEGEGEREEEAEEEEGGGGYSAQMEITMKLQYRSEVLQEEAERKEEEDEEEGEEGNRDEEDEEEEVMNGGEKLDLSLTFDMFLEPSKEDLLLFEPRQQQPDRPSSFPGRAPGNGDRITRRRASHSDSVDQTVLQVQERLQQLAESQEEAVAKGPEDELMDPLKERSHTYPLSQDTEDHTHSQHIPISVVPVDSSNTLVGSSPKASFLPHDMSRSADVMEGGESPLSSSLAKRGGGIFMRRVSVCDRKGIQGISFGTQTSMVDVDSLGFQPSPVVLLDQLVNQGEMVHHGNAQDIPLTELEGIDWFRFGGCPHSEELGQMQGQLALLHSQLLFERHQCLQHARRNRRLLRKASNAHRVKEERDYLRQQLQWQKRDFQHQEQLQKSSRAVGGEGGESRWRAENKALVKENQKLRDKNHQLVEQVHRLENENSRLQKETKEAGERLFSLQSELMHMKPQLAQAQALRGEVGQLNRELLVLGELYHSQRDEALFLLAQGGRRQEWVQLRDSLREEKEAAEKEQVDLQLEVERLRLVVEQLQAEGRKHEEENRSLLRNLQQVQGRCQEKIKATEEKYQAMVAVTKQLESQVTELRAKTVTRRKSYIHRHKRSSSHPTGPSSSPAQTTPSPLSSHTPTPTPTPI